MGPRTGRLVGLVAALLASLAVAPAANADFLKGVDVSNHQGEIKWSQVGDKIRFAFLKSSESTDFVDAWYDRNRRLAKRNGIKVGAYHFGDPDGSFQKAARRDARREARFFYNVARPRSGELLPVLDLEVTGGLPPGRLKAWAMAFMRTVDELVRGKPMIYTSPYFWQTAMDDTKWFAREGYKALWIAHWETDRPSVPADNWAGEGWTFWQYTSCGAVKGIAGCVDKNNYRYRFFRRVSIP